MALKLLVCVCLVQLLVVKRTDAEDLVTYHPEVEKLLRNLTRSASMYFS